MSKSGDVEYSIEALRDDHEFEGFDCREPSLNGYLLNDARRFAQTGIARTHVLVRNGSTKVLGYYTLVTGHVDRDQTLNLSARMRRKIPEVHPVPIIRLARLAVDWSLQGMGFGEDLLIDALRRALRTSEDVGAYGVDAHALNDKVVAFYRQYNFEVLRDDPHHVFITMATIRDSIGEW